MEFEWDENKSQSNLAKHGISFREALWIFDGRPRVNWRTQVQPEIRVATIAESKSTFYTAIWTLRNNKVRLISVRRARDEEKRIYRDVHG